MNAAECRSSLVFRQHNAPPSDPRTYSCFMMLIIALIVHCASITCVFLTSPSISRSQPSAPQWFSLDVLIHAAASDERVMCNIRLMSEMISWYPSLMTNCFCNDCFCIIFRSAHMRSSGILAVCRRLRRRPVHLAGLRPPGCRLWRAERRQNALIKLFII